MTELLIKKRARNKIHAKLHISCFHRLVWKLKLPLEFSLIEREINSFSIQFLEFWRRFRLLNPREF
jgi:hypothetical protein